MKPNKSIQIFLAGLPLAGFKIPLLTLSVNQLILDLLREAETPNFFSRYIKGKLN